MVVAVEVVVLVVVSAESSLIGEGCEDSSTFVATPPFSFPTWTTSLGRGGTLWYFLMRGLHQCCVWLNGGGKVDSLFGVEPPLARFV